VSKRLLTPKQVIDRLIWKDWEPSVAFYEGSRECRRLDAQLIRGVVAALRKRRALPLDARALVEAVDPAVADDELKRDWQAAIDGLRVLYHASPKGTSRQRELLLDVARNRKLVAAMRVASTVASDLDPTWMAVLIAEGSPKSRAVAARFRKRYAKRYPEWLPPLELFRGALDSPRHRARAPNRPRPSAAAARHASRPMTASRFWEIVDEASQAGDPAESLRERLEDLEPKQIAAFDRHFFAMLRKAYRSSLWGAAYLMRGGCSDDGFRDFRAELIARGRAVFERALKDPDSLAEDGFDIEGDEALPNVASEVFLEKTDRDLKAAAGETRRPAGKGWDFDDADEMRRRYPRLYQRLAKVQKARPPKRPALT
jgi:hypothetical protein